VPELTPGSEPPLIAAAVRSAGQAELWRPGQRPRGVDWASLEKSGALLQALRGAQARLASQNIP
jgi:hypothetical protein